MRLQNWFITNPDTDQIQILNTPISQNLVVKGSAGSGKTNMAIYRANQAQNNTFAIIVYTIALKKMVRYGMSQLNLDKDCVIHEWSWFNRGLEISGDIFCFIGNNRFGLNPNILIIQTHDSIDYYIDENLYSFAIQNGTFEGLEVAQTTNNIRVSIDFDQWVEDKFYYTFYRRSRWFKKIDVLNENFSPENKNKYVFIPSGFLFRDNQLFDYIIIDEGQDFSMSDYNNFINNAQKSITVFGDTKQQIYSDRGVGIDEIANTFNFSPLTLNYNYRLPKTIAKIAQKVTMPNIDLITNNKKNNGNSDFPTFPKPVIKKCNNWQDELDYIIKVIENEGLDDVGILLYKNEDIVRVYDYFSQKNISTQVRYTIDLVDNINAGVFPKFKTIDTLDFFNNDLPCLLTYHSAKGTEFDNVFIPFCEESNNINRNAFYVALTRSSYQLYLTYSIQLTNLFTNVNIQNDFNLK
jgi:superfamily I DNA and RNA helicase